METQHKIIETQLSMQKELMCDYTTYNHIISQPLTVYAPTSIPPFVFAGCGSEEVEP